MEEAGERELEGEELRSGEARVDLDALSNDRVDKLSHRAVGHDALERLEVRQGHMQELRRGRAAQHLVLEACKEAEVKTAGRAS